MKSAAEVVIIGGGVVGLSIAYHLAERGVTDIVVLEKEDMVGTGSTGRCAGGFRHQFSTEVNIRLSLLSVSKLERFPEELEQPIDFHQDGYLFLLQRPGEVESFRQNVQLQQRLGVPVELVKPEEIDEFAAIQLSSEIAHKIEESLDYPGQIKVCVVRETRAVDYAR